MRGISIWWKAPLTNTPLCYLVCSSSSLLLSMISFAIFSLSSNLFLTLPSLFLFCCIFFPLPCLLVLVLPFSVLYFAVLSLFSSSSPCLTFPFLSLSSRLSSLVLVCFRHHLPLCSILPSSPLSRLTSALLSAPVYILLCCLVASDVLVFALCVCYCPFLSMPYFTPFSWFLSFAIQSYSFLISNMLRTLPSLVLPFFVLFCCHVSLLSLLLYCIFFVLFFLS